MLTFYCLFCSAKLKELPFTTDDVFCTVHFRGYYVVICVSTTCKSPKQSHMKQKRAAHHITPWVEDGSAPNGNCQMLCRTSNRMDGYKWTNRTRIFRYVADEWFLKSPKCGWNVPQKGVFALFFDFWVKKLGKCLVVTKKLCTFALAIQKSRLRPDDDERNNASLAQLVEQLTLNQWV